MRNRSFAALLLAAALSTMFPYSVGQTICTFVPRDSASIRKFPEFGILGIAPVGGDIQSSYFRTTPQNREFRRGFFEFSIPVFPSGILGARLILTEGRGTRGNPVPPDQHELSYYASDLEITTDDFDRPATVLATFETDANLEQQTFFFDATSAYNQLACLNPGFRVKLTADPSSQVFGSFGSSFREASMESGPPTFEITLPAGEPPCSPSLTFESSGTVMSWSPASAATSYDVVRGSILNLRAHGGYSGVVQECLANNQVSSSLMYAGQPPAGDAYWFLVRPEYDCGCGSYDSFFRDTLQACPCD